MKEWTNCSKYYWTPGPEVVVDESIYEYEVKSYIKKKYEDEKDPIPHHYIPRKPHPNGLLSWTVATKSFHTKLTYILDIIPHYR